MPQFAIFRNPFYNRDPGSDNELSPWILEGEGITWTTDRIQKAGFKLKSEKIKKTYF